MSISQVLDVAIGLALVYYVLGLVVSFVSGRILETFETRGRDLEIYLKKIVGEARLGDLLAEPQIKALAPVKYAGWRGALRGDVIAKKVQNVPVSNLVDAMFEMHGLVEQPASADALKAILSNFPDSEFKRHLLQSAERGVTDLNQLRNKTTLWLNGVTDQAAALYKAHARQWVIGLSLAVTLVLGVDSLDLASQLWHNADLRAVAAAKAQAYVSRPNAPADINPLLQDMQALSPQLGWAAVPGAWPKDAAPLAKAWWIILKIVGLAITFAAVSQGSSFWYDILRQLKGENAKPAAEAPVISPVAPAQ